MATPDSTYEQALDTAASLNNDTDRAVYTNAVMLPYLQVALQELQETYEENQIPVTTKSEEVLSIPAGTSVIGFATTPALPSDLIEISELWERNHNIDPFVEMVRCDYLPHYQQGVENSQFVWWAWQRNAIHVLPSNSINDLKLDYICNLFPTLTLGTIDDAIGVINALTFLQFRTGALAAQFIGENETRAESLNQMAILAIQRTLTIETKGRQSIAYRRRPFRAAYKTRGN